LDRLVFLTAHQLAQLIRDREVTAVEVVEAHLQQIERHNPALNAIATLNAEAALREARAADEAMARRDRVGILHGVPITIKDSFETRGLRTTSSYAPLANYIPARDATAVARLLRAGAIVIGKTNLPRLTGDFQRNSPLFGRSNNPWQLDRTPGGSTGGGAAAIASGMSPLELGGDYGGSIRVPAHFCGAIGFKPTEYRVSSAGHIPNLPDQPRSIRHLQTIGPLARSIEDVRLCLKAIEGPDERQPEVPPTSSEPFREDPLSSYRFAWSAGFGEIPVAAEVRDALQQLALQLDALDCRVERHPLPPFDWAIAKEAYTDIATFELGLQSLDPSSLHSRSRYIAALSQRDRLIAQLDRFLSEWDAWLCPVAPISAFPHCPPGTPIDIDGIPHPYLRAIGAYTTTFNLTGHPVVVLPIAQSRDGLPIGVQVVGRRWRDMELLTVAQRLVEVTAGFQLPPGY
jgi:amidase